MAVTRGFNFADVAICLRLLAYHKLHLRELVSHLLPVDRAPEVYPALERGDQDYPGVVFDWTGEGI